MGLRNAFDDMGLEGTLRKILNAVTYARTPSDQMRVVTDTGSVVNANVTNTLNTNTYNRNSTTNVNGSTNAMWDQSSWNVMDGRETARQASETQFVMTRQRWSIT